MTRPDDDKRKLWVVEIWDGINWWPTPVFTSGPRYEAHEYLIREKERAFPGGNTRIRLYVPAEEKKNED